MLMAKKHYPDRDSSDPNLPMNRPKRDGAGQWTDDKTYEEDPQGGGLLYGIIDPDYARIFTMARCLAWAEGYALLFHGSFTRDLDLIAVPWTAAACEPDHLQRRIVAAADLRSLDEKPSTKEHGRLVWTLVFKGFGDPRFIDFSVMPRGLSHSNGERDAG